MGKRVKTESCEIEYYRKVIFLNGLIIRGWLVKLLINTVFFRLGKNSSQKSQKPVE